MSVAGCRYAGRAGAATGRLPGSAWYERAYRDRLATGEAWRSVAETA